MAIATSMATIIVYLAEPACARTNLQGCGALAASVAGMAPGILVGGLVGGAGVFAAGQ